MIHEMIATLIEANRQYIIGGIIPLASVAISYIDYLSEYIKFGGLCIGFGVGCLTFYKLILEIRKLKSK